MKPTTYEWINGKRRLILKGNSTAGTLYWLDMNNPKVYYRTHTIFPTDCAPMLEAFKWLMNKT